MRLAASRGLRGDGRPVAVGSELDHAGAYPPNTRVWQTCAVWVNVPLLTLKEQRSVSKNTICLWYNKYLHSTQRRSTPQRSDSTVGAVHIAARRDYPSGKQGDVLTVEFTIMGIPCLGLNGGPEFKRDEDLFVQSPPTTRLKPTGCERDCWKRRQ